MSKEQEGHAGSSRAAACDYVLVGYGDYGRNYVVPGLVQAIERELVPTDFRVIVVDRQEPRVREHPARGSFVQMDLRQLRDYGRLRERLRERLGDGHGRRRVFHFAVAPALYPDIARNLKVSGLAQGDFIAVIEKPVGKDGRSCRDLQDALSKQLGADKVVYSDHYLAKPALDGIRHAFEREIDPATVRAIRIATLEERGIAGRGEFFDATGALRDVLCHLLKVAATALGEPGSDAVARRVGFVQQLHVEDGVRAQYTAGPDMVGYTEEVNVRPDSPTETYFALALRIAGGRWADIPLVLEAGKASARREGSVRVEFNGADTSSRTFPIHHREKNDVLEHARLAIAVCSGDRGLWADADEVRQEWRLVAEAQALASFTTLHHYAAGTLRPEAARRLLLS